MEERQPEAFGFSKEVAVVHGAYEIPVLVQPVSSGRPEIAPARKRLRNIDALRGICAILVVLTHTFPLTWLGAGSWPSDPLFYLDFGRIGVAAFFLISGYVIPFSIPNGGQPIRRFWIARFFRLWPAYWVCILLTLLAGSSEIPMTLKNVVFNFSMLQRFFGIKDMVGVFWTLQIELLFYALITVMVAAGIARNSRYYRIGFYVMVGCSLSMSLLRGLSGVRLPVALPMALTLMFLAGYIRTCRINAKPVPRVMIASYVASLIPICLLGYSKNLSGADDPYRWILAYLLGLFIFLLFESLTDAPAVAVFMGTISYSIYLLHPVVMHVTRNILGSANAITNTAFVLALTTAASWIVYRLVEMPSQRWAKSLIKRLQARVS